MLTLVMTRHGHTEPADVMLGGQLDLPLSPKGRKQAEALADRLRGLQFDRIVSSPMLRALETAQIVATGRPIEVDERLRELDYGRWEGLTYPEIDARDPGLRLVWEADPADTHSPGGESGNEVAARAHSYLEALLEEAEAAARDAESEKRAGAALQDRPLRPAAVQFARPAASQDPSGGRGGGEPEPEWCVLSVAHGTFNRIMLSVALGIPVRDYRRRFTQDRCNLTVIQFERGAGVDQARLVLMNDTAHLHEPGEPPWG